MSWKTETEGRERTVIHWPKNVDWSKPNKIRGGNPILFPFAARTFADGKIGYWKNPLGEICPMPMHGIARSGKFRLESLDKKGFTARFLPDDASREAYPYDYEFRVCYAFSELVCKVSMSLKNLGTKPLPWCAGHHFYFELPWHEGLNRSDYILLVPTHKAFRHDDNGRLIRYPLETNTAVFSDPKICDRIHAGLRNNKTTFGAKAKKDHVVIQIGDELVPAPWDTIVTWTESDDSPFYCVEPWMGPPNSPTHGKGIRYVAPNDEDVFNVSISLATS